MKTLFKGAVWSIVVIFAVTLLGGIVAVWPFRAPETRIAITRPDAPAMRSDANENLLAGIGVRDITPPIGIPKMGYSAWAREADGFRTRLKVRAFYLKTANGSPVVVVQADLPASSLVLRHKVAERVAALTDIPFSALSIHVTHTHSGPGQYFENDVYNTFGSNRPGFDPDVFEFLATQITDAVVDAYRNRRPAKVSIGQTELYGATKNRSIGAYVKNANGRDTVANEVAALRAVNPKITLVRIDAQDTDGQWKPWGAFSTFAIHGTGIPPFTHPYHGDVWAFFERELEDRILRHYQPSWHPVHGPFEANHGDNNPNYINGLRGDRETRRIGMMIARRAWKLFTSLDEQGQSSLQIRHAMREIDVLAPRGDEAAPLCDRAIIGAATVGSAHGDEVFPLSYVPPFVAGWPKTGSSDCHKEKQWMMSWLQVWGVAPERYPHRVNASVIQVGDLVLAGLPFEITFESGNRIEAAIRDRLKTVSMTPRYVVVSSHTDGFFGYSTTPEEYSAQYYEGGHTIYGPGTTDFLARTASQLASDMILTPDFADMPLAWTFAMATHRYSPQPRAVTGGRALLSSPVFHESTASQEARWSFMYADVAPADLRLHEPLLSVQTRRDGGEWRPLTSRGVTVDDEGVDLQVRYATDIEDGRSSYEISWYNPPVAEARQEFRIVIEPRGKQPRWVSPPFGGG